MAAREDGFGFGGGVPTPKAQEIESDNETLDSPESIDEDQTIVDYSDEDPNPIQDDVYNTDGPETEDEAQHGSDQESGQGDNQARDAGLGFGFGSGGASETPEPHQYESDNSQRTISARSKSSGGSTTRSLSSNEPATLSARSSSSSEAKPLSFQKTLAGAGTHSSPVLAITTSTGKIMSTSKSTVSVRVGAMARSKSTVGRGANRGHLRSSSSTYSKWSTTSGGGDVEKNHGDWLRILQQKQKEVEELQATLDDIAAERDVLLFQARTTHEDAQSSAEQASAALAESEEARIKAESKVKDVESIQEALVALAMRMRDRSLESEGAETDVNSQWEASQLRAMSVNDVLTYLSASLEVLWEFKEDAAGGLVPIVELQRRGMGVGSVDSRVLKRAVSYASSSSLGDLARQPSKSNLGSSLGKESLDRLPKFSGLNKADKIRAARAAADATTVAVIEELQSDNLRLIQIIKDKDEELDERDSLISGLKRKLKEKEVALGAVPALEAKLVTLKASHTEELQRIKHRHSGLVETLNKELSAYVRVEADAKMYKQRVIELEESLSGMKREKVRVSLQQVEGKLDRTTRALEASRVEVTSLQAEIRKVQWREEETLRKNRILRREYDRLASNAARSIAHGSLSNVNNKSRGKQGKLRPSSAPGVPRSKAGLEEAVNNSPALADVYKAQLREKEREIDELRLRLRRTQNHVQRQAISAKAAASERAELSNELAEARGSRGSMSATEEVVALRNRVEQLYDSNLELRMKLTDMKNVEGLARSTALAYERLKKRTDAALDPVGTQSKLARGPALANFIGSLKESRN